ncbi:MAG TPA: SH3 domain-containing protein [Deferrisomatales bacterium]|nr:SH3 domain-containing protein [Deferrisomatales bacterium]
MRHPVSIASALVLALLLATAVAAQTTVWVASQGATLKAEKKALSGTVAALTAGTALTVLETDAKWYRVNTPEGKQGWIYRGKVSDTPPAQEQSGSGGLFGAVTGSSIEAGAADTSRSIRGLSPETEQYANNAGSPQQNRDALDRLMALNVTAPELERFLQDGRIGEYAE